MSALSNFDEWRALKPLTRDQNEPWGTVRFKVVYSASPEGDHIQCTLCGAVISTMKVRDADAQEAMERHTLWHASMLAPQHQDREERRHEKARADTVALRAELADTPPGSNPRNCRS